MGPAIGQAMRNAGFQGKVTALRSLDERGGGGRWKSLDRGGGPPQVGGVAGGATDFGIVGEDMERTADRRREVHSCATLQTGTARWGAALLCVENFAVTHPAMPPSRTTARNPAAMATPAARSATISPGSES